MVVIKSHIRECDTSTMRYFTPKMYCQMNGVYISSEQEIDDVSHQWDANVEAYNKGVVPDLPVWMHEYIESFFWLHNAKVELLETFDECPDHPMLEKAVFRFTPDDSYKGISPKVVSFTSGWFNRRTVLPVQLIESGKGYTEFLYDEFTLDSMYECCYQFFCKDGIEYSFDNIYRISWEDETEELAGNYQKSVDKTIRETLAAKSELPAKRKGRERVGCRLFSLIFKFNGYQYVEQIKSKDWSTVWGDFQKVIANNSEIGQEILAWEEKFAWEEKLSPFHKDTRNVFVGRFWIDSEEVEVLIVNTKRGKPIGADEFEDSIPACDMRPSV